VVGGGGGRQWEAYGSIWAAAKPSRCAASTVFDGGSGLLAGRRWWFGSLDAGGCSVVTGTPPLGQAAQGGGIGVVTVADAATISGRVAAGER
jgi:hypothetical protein